MQKYSTKSKWVVFLLLVIGFPLGLHAFYAGKIKKALFYCITIGLVIAYYSFLIYNISTSKYASWLNLSIANWINIYLVLTSVIQYFPFFGWLSYLGPYLVFILLVGIFYILLDLILIILGQYKDSNGLKIVRKSKKKSLDLIP